MGFEMFSIAHITAILAALAAFACVIVFRRQLRQPGVNKRFRIGLAVLLISCEISLQLSYVLGDQWNAGSLPFQLCSLTLLISAVLLLTRNEGLYSIVFFLGMLGAVQALVTPNLDQSFPHFRYFHFFIAHIGIIATGLYVVLVERYRPTLRSMLGALLWLHVLAIPAFIVNTLTGWTNFMFLAGKPATASLLDILAPWPWYLLQLEGIALLLCFMLLGFVRGVEWISGH